MHLVKGFGLQLRDGEERVLGLLTEPQSKMGAFLTRTYRNLATDSSYRSYIEEIIGNDALLEAQLQTWGVIFDELGIPIPKQQAAVGV